MVRWDREREKAKDEREHRFEKGGEEKNEAELYREKNAKIKRERNGNDEVRKKVHMAARGSRF